MRLIPGQGTKILHATWCGQKKTKQNWLSLLIVYINTMIIIYYIPGTVLNTAHTLCHQTVLIILRENYEHPHYIAKETETIKGEKC